VGKEHGYGNKGTIKCRGITWNIGGGPIYINHRTAGRGASGAGRVFKTNHERWRGYGILRRWSAIWPSGLRGRVFDASIAFSGGGTEDLGRQK